jgi:hypothetical protein
MVMILPRLSDGSLYITLLICSTSLVSPLAFANNHPTRNPKALLARAITTAVNIFIIICFLAYTYMKIKGYKKGEVFTLPLNYSIVLY